jgi:hypothetical protein
MSNGTHLSNFAGNKTECHEYMTFGNLPSKICQMPSTHTIVMVALQLITIKHNKIRQNLQDEQRHTNREVLINVLWRLLQPQTIKQNPSAETQYQNILCANGNFRRCKPVFAAWFAE